MSVSKSEELFVGELRDVYHAEKQLVAALPKLVDEARHPALKATLTDRLAAAKAHVERLVEAFELLDGGRRSRRCDAARNMSGGASGPRGQEVGRGR